MEGKNKLILGISHPGIGNGIIIKKYEIASEYTTVNSMRKVVQSWASVYGLNYELERDKIRLHLENGRYIFYKDIQTKKGQGITSQIISFDELFSRSGEIFINKY